MAGMRLPGGYPFDFSMRSIHLKIKKIHCIFIQWNLVQFIKNEIHRQMDGTENYREEFNQDSGRQMSHVFSHIWILYLNI